MFVAQKTSPTHILIVMADSIEHLNRLNKLVKYEFMLKRNLILIVGVIAIIAYSCNFPKTELKEIKFDSGMQAVADKYKEQLEPEIFQTSPGWFRFDTVTTHKVVVALLNSKNLPESENKIKDIAINLASDVYSQLINKDDFSKIEIVFQNETGKAVKMKMKRNYPFSYDEIEKHRTKGIN